MNSKEWRDRGFATLFRGISHGFAENVVILVHRKTRDARFAPVLQGEWMKLRSFSDFSSTGLVEEDHHTLDRCYCDQGCDTCDFCAGLRAPPIPGSGGR